MANNSSVFGHGPMGTTCGTKAIKIENETKHFAHAKITLPMMKKIQQARVNAGLTQKQLAQALNVKPQIIQSYENGKAIPFGRVIQKIEKACRLEFGAISGKNRSKNKTQGTNTNNKKKKKKKSKDNIRKIYTKPRKE